MTLSELKEKGLAPEFLQEDGFTTLSNGYLLPEETPFDMYKRLSHSAASYYKDAQYWEQKFFDTMWNGWLCPASPVLANLGTKRGLPISCNSIHIDDSVDSIFKKNHELAILGKNGAGVGIYLGDIRARNSPINGNGRSEGVVPWSKLYDTSCAVISQGSTRRGAAALYLPIEHGDIDEFLDIRRPVGDLNRRCLNIHHAVTITNKWMEEMLDGDAAKQEIYKKVLRSRVETGEPYIFFSDNVNDNRPECYKKNNLFVKTSNICSEIVEYTDPEHTFVCCLSSLNLTKWDEWKDTDLPQIAVRFLDAVMQEYIDKSKNITGLECSRRAAIKERSIGIGVLGYHSLLQSKGLPFDSFDSMMLNNQIFKTIRQKAELETAVLAKELGEPEWCKGFGRRNSHVMALAPTVSNSTIVGGVSPSIEPWTANIFSQKSAKGTFIKRNPYLEKLLKEKGEDNEKTWKSIIESKGSVQQLTCLSDEEKTVFLTAREINQFAIIKQAVQRQKYIDQAQSLNLFFSLNADPKYIHNVHLEAWKGGLKTLYYMRTEGVLRGDLASRSPDECVACGG